MNRSITKGTTAFIGVATAAWIISTGPAMPSKKQSVMWQISGQLNDLNSGTGSLFHASAEERALEAREQVYG